MQYIYLIMFLISGYYISTRLKISFEHGVFMYACSSFTILFLLGFVDLLKVGIWVIMGFAALSLIFTVVYIIKNKPKLSTILTPGILIIIIAFVIYSIMVKDVRMYQWDEATHWGTTVKYLYGTDKLWTSGLQTIGMPLFNYIITQVAGYKENLLYLSQWFFSWSCMTLIVSEYTYKDWKKLLVFALGAYLGMASFLYSGQISLYADIVLGIMPASILISWFLSKNSFQKNIIWITPAMFMLAQIKSGTGVAFAVLLLAVMLIFGIYNKIDKKKLFLLLIPLAAAFISSNLAGVITDKYIGTGISRSSNLGELFTSTNLLYITIALAFISLTAFTVYIIKKRNDKSLSHLWWSIPAVICFLSLIALCIIVGTKREGIDVLLILKTFIKSYGTRFVVYFPMWFLIVVMAVGTIVQILIKKEKQRTILLYGAVWAVGAFYTLGIFLSYVLAFSPHEANTCASFERYMATILIFVFLSVLSSIFMQDREECIRKSKAITYILLAVFAVSTIIYPKELTTRYLVEYSKETTDAFRNELAYGARIINKTVPDDEKIFIIIQDDQGYLYNWLKYEVSPRIVNGGYWSISEDKFADGMDGDWLTEFMEEKGYKYLYIHYSSPFFDTSFDDVFAPKVNEMSLYKLIDGILTQCN